MIRIAILCVCLYLLASLIYTAGRAVFDPSGSAHAHKALVNSMTE